MRPACATPSDTTLLTLPPLLTLALHQTRGTRVNAFVGGGARALPVAARGGRVLAGPTDLMHISDWYATLADMAGVDISSENVIAAATGLPPLDSLSMWPLITGTNTTSPRNELQLSTQALVQCSTAAAGALNQSTCYKLVVGKQPMNGWTGPRYPNASGPQPTFIPKGWEHNCGAGELYDILGDPTEHVNLAAAQPALLAAMQARLAQLNEGYFDPKRGKPDHAACKAAKARGGYYGPFVNPK